MGAYLGAYLPEPLTDKISNDECSKRLSYGASSMQGWRASQEDSHNCIIDFDASDTSLFAVYDGHGGAEVAKYCSANLPDCIRSTAEYKKGNFSQALEDAFLEFDQCLTKEEVVSEMKQIAGFPESDDEDSDEDAAALKEEADLPLDEVLARYETTAVKKMAPHVKGYEQPKSPMLRGKKAESGDGVNGLSTSEDVAPDGEVNEENASSVNGDISNKGDGSVSEKEILPKCETVPNDTVEEKVTKVPKKKTLEKSDAIQAGCSSSGSSRKKPRKKSSYTVTKESSSGEDDSEDDEEFKAESDSSEEEEESQDEGSDSEDEEEEEESGSDESAEDETDACDSNQMNSAEGPGLDSGCTAVVALLKGNQLYVANAGDSRCVISREGKAVNLSNDHKPEDQIERDRIVNAGGRVTSDGRVNGGLNLSRAIGDHAYKDNDTLSAREQMITALPDIQTLVVNPKEDDFMVLACDGIWNSLSSQEVVDFVQKRFKDDVKLSSICEELMDHCLAPNSEGDGTGCDNMTVIIVKFHNLDSETNKRSLESNGQSSDQETPAQKKLKLEESTPNV